MYITVFTPAYNRAHTLERVYESLKKQSFKNFEWIIVDDGSTDDTELVIKKFMEEGAFFDIHYYYQTNQGKHNATNSAVSKAKGDFFITLDSDDACKPNAIEVFVNIWNSIPEQGRCNYKGVACRCCSVEKPDEILGTPFRSDVFDSDDNEIRLKYKIKGELWGMTRIDVLKQNPYPNIAGLSFYPENVYWGEISLMYKTRYINTPLRFYNIEEGSGDQLTSKIRYNESFFIRKYNLSKKVISSYFRYNPIYFYKQAVGLARDGFLGGKNISDLLKVPETMLGKILFVFALPIGKMLQLKARR